MRCFLFTPTPPGYLSIRILLLQFFKEKDHQILCTLGFLLQREGASLLLIAIPFCFQTTQRQWKHPFLVAHSQTIPISWHLLTQTSHNSWRRFARLTQPEMPTPPTPPQERVILASVSSTFQDLLSYYLQVPTCMYQLLFYSGFFSYRIESK